MGVVSFLFGGELGQELLNRTFAEKDSVVRKILVSANRHFPV